MSAHKVITLFAICIIAPLIGMAQYVELTRFSRTDALYLNPDRLVDYNLYEHVRLGAGLRYTHTGRLQSNGRVSISEVEGYLAYGVRDTRWKGGLSAAYTAPNRRLWHPYAYAFYDLSPAASRRMDAHHLTDLAHSVMIATHRFAESGVVGMGFTFHPTARLLMGVEGRWSYETPLYNHHTTLYLGPDLRHRDLGRGRYTEAVLSMQHSKGLRAEMVVGYAHDIQQPILRLIAQYKQDRTLGHLTYNLYAQAGAASGGTPYSRLFDMGGCLGSPLALEQTLLTTRSGQYGGNLFGIATLRVSTTQPLVQWYNRDFQIGTRPLPFMQIGAAWSHLNGQDQHGTALVPRGEAMPDGSPLAPLPWQALDRGIVELCAGIDGLLRVGLVAAGVAVAWQYTPPSAIYHQPTAHNRPQLLFTASLMLDGIL